MPQRSSTNVIRSVFMAQTDQVVVEWLHHCDRFAARLFHVRSERISFAIASALAIRHGFSSCACVAIDVIAPLPIRSRQKYLL